MSADSQTPEGFRQEKGTDYPAEPHGKVEEYPAERAEFPTDPLPQGTSGPSASVLGIKVIWVAIGGVVVFAGIFGYAYLRRLPFRVENDSITIRDSHGGSITIDTQPELPDTFPEDIPIFPDAELQPSVVDLTSHRDPEQEGSLYLWQAPAPLEDVAFWYADELALRGWDIPLKTPSDDGVIYTVTKDGRGFLIEFHGVSSTLTDVSLIFTQEFPQ